MKKEHVPSILLVLLYIGLLINTTTNIVVDGVTSIRALNIVLDAVILIAIYSRTAEWARKTGIVFSTIKILLGAVAVALGLLRLITVNIDGVGLILAGFIGIGLGFWTIAVLRKVESAYSANAA